MNSIVQCLAFARELEGLKSVLRTAWTARGRQESTAEHSWRLAMLCAVLAGEYPHLNGSRLLLMCLVHDVGERYTGDVSAALCPDADAKLEEEREAAGRLFGLLPEPVGGELLEIWEEYNACQTPEARLVKALDKAETILQHNQGSNPPGFDYAFNLEYGRKLFEGDPLLEELREILDGETRARME